jgi:ABC-type transporter Mla subunit MlaD
LGQPFVTITPGPADNPPMAPGTVIAGETPFTIEDLFARVTAVATRAEEALKNVNRLIGDPELAAGLSETVRNAKEATAAVRETAEHVQRIADNVERTTRTLDKSVSTEVPAIAKELRAMSADLAAAAHDIREMVHDVAADGRTAAQVKDTIGAIQRTAQRIEKMANDLSGVINEQEVRSVRGSIAEAQSAVTEARQAIGEARGLIGRASTVVDRVGRVLPDKLEIPDFRNSYRLEYEIYYTSRIGHDITFTLLPGAKRQYVLTWRDIGQTARLGLQIGNRLDDTLTLRWGLIDSQVGVGLDYQPAPASLYSVDLYNLNQITMNVYARYFLAPEHGISLRVSNLLQTPTVGLGYFRRF